jgi:hypothetical protein
VSHQRAALDAAADHGLVNRLGKSLRQDDDLDRPPIVQIFGLPIGSPSNGFHV